MSAIVPNPTPDPLVPRLAALPARDSEDSADASSGLSPAKLLHALRRRWLIAIPLALVAGVAAGWVGSTRVTPIYTARTLLQVQSPTLLYPDVVGRQDTANSQRTQIATVKSRLVGQSAVRELQPLNLTLIQNQADPVGWLEREIQADFSVAPEIMRISLKASNPDELLVVLNAVRDAYVREVVNRERNDRISHLKQLRDLAKKDEASLTAQRQQLTAKAESLGARDYQTLREQYNYVLKRINSLKELLTTWKSSLKQAELEGTTPLVDPPLDPVAIDSATTEAMTTDTKASGLRQDIFKLDSTIADYQRRLVNYAQDPDYQKKVSELKDKQIALEARRQELKKIATQQRRDAAREQQRQQLANRDQLLATVRKSLPEVEDVIRNQEQEATKLGKGLAELDQLQDAIYRDEERLKLVNTRIQQIEVELQAPSRARLLEEALIVETPRWDRQLKLIVAPGVGAFVVVLLLVAWLDLRTGRVDSIDDLAAKQIRVIGTVPAVRDNVLHTFSTPEQSNDRREYLQLTDAFDMARAVIAPALHPIRATVPQGSPLRVEPRAGMATVLPAGRGYVLVVTSAAAGEGKTVLSGHLAVRLARSGRRTLLIDTDVRRPRIHSLFGIEAGPGLGELLLGEVELPEVIRPGPVPGIDVITAGARSPHTVCELLDYRLSGILKALKMNYDVILLDTAPLLIAPETLTASQSADGVLLSVMRDVSRVPGVLASYQKLSSVNARILGAIMTGDTSAQYGGY